jgi:hypothetical protein
MKTGPASCGIRTHAATFVALLLFVVLDAVTASAQQAQSATTGVIAGVAVDSVRGGFLHDAIVTVVGTNLSAISDSVGRFQLDSVPAGMRTLRLQHPLLDTLGVTVVTPVRELRAGEALSFVLAVPSPATIVQAKCSPTDRSRGKAAIAGMVIDADTEAPSTGAQVVVEWIDYTVGTRSIGKTPEKRVGKVRADGSYLICGIPEDLTTGVVATRGADSTGAVSVSFERMLAIQSFAFPEATRAPIATTDSAQSPASRSTAVLSGSIVDPAGKPLGGARVSIEADQLATVSAADGSFALRGARSGTRSVTVRKLGFEPVEVAVNLLSRRAVNTVLQLRKPVQTLEAVRVSAMRDIGLQRVGFSERKRLGNGKYYSPTDIERRNPLRLNYLLETAPMLKTGRTADGKRYITGRGYRPCIRYYVDGHLTMEYSPTDLEMLPDSYVNASELGAVEVYDKMSVPGEFLAISRSGQVCSVVVVWTKWKIGVR